MCAVAWQVNAEYTRGKKTACCYTLPSAKLDVLAEAGKSTARLITSALPPPQCANTD